MYFSFSGKKYTSGGQSQKLDISAFQTNTVVGNSLISTLNGGAIYSSSINQHLSASYKDTQGFHKANIVFADVIFRTSEAGIVKDYKFPIRTPSKWIFSLEEGTYSGEYGLNFKEGLQKKYEFDNSFLSRFHEINNGIDNINLNVHTESNYKRQFDNYFKHSENALFLYLSSCTVISMLVEELLSKVGAGTTILHEVIFNIHSTREICAHCREGVNSLLDTESKFFNGLKSVLIEKIRNDKEIHFASNIGLSLNCTYFINSQRGIAQDYNLQPSIESDFYHTHTSFLSGSKSREGFTYYNQNLWQLISAELGHAQSRITNYLEQMKAEHDIFKGRLISNIQKQNQANEVKFTIQQLDAFTLNIMLLLEGHLDLVDEEMLDIADVGVRPIKVLEPTIRSKQEKVVDIDIEELIGVELPESLLDLFYVILPLARANENSYSWGFFETSLAEYIGFLLGINDPSEMQADIYSALACGEESNNGSNEKDNLPALNSTIQKYAPGAIDPSVLSNLIIHKANREYLSKQLQHSKNLHKATELLSERLDSIQKSNPRVKSLVDLAVELEGIDESIAIYKFDEVFERASEAEQNLYYECCKIDMALSPLYEVMRTINDIRSPLLPINHTFTGVFTEQVNLSFEQKILGNLEENTGASLIT